MKKIRFPIPIPFLRLSPRGQAFVEMAILLPILILILLGVVEVSVFISRYLDLLDLTREAARFGSTHDPFVPPTAASLSCSDSTNFNFYYHTSCIFSPPRGATCAFPQFCNGLNPYLDFKQATDDVVISVYTVKGNNKVSDVLPKVDRGGTLLPGSLPGEDSYYWALSDHDQDTANSSNWKKDCHGNEITDSPHFTRDTVNEILVEDTATPNRSKGFIAVEAFYCHQQLLGLPILTDIIPNPMMIHAYTFMPLPEAQPTATPKP